MSGPNRSNIWTGSWERGVEESAISRLGTVGIQASINKTCNTVIAAGEQNSDPHKTKLSELSTLPSGVSGCEVGFVVIV